MSSHQSLFILCQITVGSDNPVHGFRIQRHTLLQSSEGSRQVIDPYCPALAFQERWRYFADISDIAALPIGYEGLDRH